MKNVIIQVCDFSYTVNFTICDIQPSTTPGELYVLLGRLFLATSKASIDCYTGWMFLSFGSVKLRINIFEDDTLRGYVDDNDSKLAAECWHLRKVYTRVPE